MCMCLFQSVTNGIKKYFVYFGVNKGGLHVYRSACGSWTRVLWEAAEVIKGVCTLGVGSCQGYLPHTYTMNSCCGGGGGH